MSKSFCRTSQKKTLNLMRKSDFFSRVLEKSLAAEDFFADHAFHGFDKNEILSYENTLPKSTRWTQDLYRQIVDSNRGLLGNHDMSSMILVDSDGTNTGVRKSEDSVIVVDSIYLKFLWMMNVSKACSMIVGGELSTSIISKSLLYNHAKKFDVSLDDFKFSDPFGTIDEILNSLDQLEKKRIRMLAISDQIIQVVFIIAHEIAHLELGHLDKPATSSLEKEESADRLALELSLNTFAVLHEDECRPQFFNAIFTFFRYSLWASVMDGLSSHGHSNGLEENWIVRNSTYRKVVESEYLLESERLLFVELLDWIEANMEPGWYVAMTTVQQLGKVNYSALNSIIAQVVGWNKKLKWERLNQVTEYLKLLAKRIWVSRLRRSVNKGHVVRLIASMTIYCEHMESSKIDTIAHPDVDQELRQFLTSNGCRTLEQLKIKTYTMSSLLLYADLKYALDRIQEIKRLGIKSVDDPNVSKKIRRFMIQYGCTTDAYLNSLINSLDRIVRWKEKNEHYGTVVVNLG